VNAVTVTVSPGVATVIHHCRNCNTESWFMERLAGWPEVWIAFCTGTNADSAACERVDW